MAFKPANGDFQINKIFASILTNNILPFLENKTNRRTALQFYWYYDRLLLGAGWNHPAPGSKRSSNLHKMYQCRCMAKNS